MNQTSQAIISFVFSKFIAAAGGKIGGDIADAILQMVFGGPPDLSSEILTQVKNLQTQVSGLAAQTAAAVQYGDKHTNLIDGISDIDIIIKFTAGQQTNPAQLSSVMDEQWETLINFLNPGTGGDYASLSSDLLLAVYNVPLNQLAASAVYGTGTNCYAYQMNQALLAENPLYLGDYISAHVLLLTSVLADISAVTNAAAAALQSIQTIYAARTESGSKFSTLSAPNQQNITELMNSSAAADLKTVSPGPCTQFYTNAAACLQNAPAALCANAYTDFANITAAAEVSIVNTDIAPNLYLMISPWNSPALANTYLLPCISAPSPPISLWITSFSDSSGNLVTISNAQSSGLLYSNTHTVYLTPSKTNYGEAQGNTSLYFNWYLQLWGKGDPDSIKFYYRITDQKLNAMIPAAAAEDPGTFEALVGSGQSLFSLVWNS